MQFEIKNENLTPKITIVLSLFLEKINKKRHQSTDFYIFPQILKKGRRRRLLLPG